jgi:4-amino-4-deoxy-L-arabinose transferase-like glycosyltransferase
MNKTCKTALHLNNANGWVILLLGIWWIANLFQAAFMELHYDEAYYWVFSQHLAWGYFDHPPMTALLIRLGSIFNNNEFGVRLFITLLQPVYLYLFWALLRPKQCSIQYGILYVLLCASVPMMQVYGFIATPDAPLMFFTVLLLVVYQRFVASSKVIWTLLLGLCMGLLAYSKYHGAIVVLCIVLSNLRLLRLRRFYLAALVAFIVLLPHLYWQYAHDWASFRYHLMDRNKTFRWNYVSEYLLNIVGCYNPMLVPVAVYAMFKNKAANIIERTIYCIAIFFFAFFLLSTLRGYVQPQWTLPMAYSIVFALFLFAVKNTRTARYLMRVGYVTVGLLLIARVAVMSGVLSNTGLVFFNNKIKHQRIAAVANGTPVLFAGYKSPSLYAFYTRQPCDEQKTFNGRKSQYYLWSLDEPFRGQRVMIEVPESDNCEVIELPQGKKFYYIFDIY